MKTFTFCCVFLAFAVFCQASSSFDRELVVKNKERSVQVENVLKKLLRAYEDEDARTFLDYVSEDRFRQDYLTFTDALYNDFRTYEIYRIDYVVNRVVPDNMKQTMEVKWEKRYETLDDAQQLSDEGLSQFVFDEINGEYLLIELAGNDLFGASLPEWTDETPNIPGQELSSNPSSGSSNPSSGKSDLIIGSVVEGESAGYATVTIQVRNIGIAVSQPTTMDVDIDMNLSSFSVNIGALPAGGSFTYTCTADQSASNACPDSNGWGVSVVVEEVNVDPNSLIDELSESNNKYTQW